MEQSFTRALADRCLRIESSDIPAAVAAVARQCLLDWLGVTLAARREPLVEALAHVLPHNLAAGCTIVGRDGYASEFDAALLNGAMGHALDYDDAMIVMGHPTAPIVPALTNGEELSASAAVAIPAIDVEAQWSRVAAKFHTLVTPVVGMTRVKEIECSLPGTELPSVRALTAMLRG